MGFSKSCSNQIQTSVLNKNWPRVATLFAGTGSVGSALLRVGSKQIVRQRTRTLSKLSDLIVSVEVRSKGKE